MNILLIDTRILFNFLMFHLIIKTKVDYVFQIKKNLVMAKYLMDGADLEMMKKIGSASITTI